MTALNIKYSPGFSLIELAVVMLIVGLLLNGLLVAVGQSTENTRRLAARNELRQIQEALYGFAQVQKRLPCPADYDTSGVEDVTSTTTGTCNLYHGLLPNATLNLSGSINDDGLLTDPWGNPYRYSVATTTPNGSRYTGSTGISAIFADSTNQVVSSANMLTVCDDSSDGESCAAGSNTIAEIVPALVLSLGKNGAEISASSSAKEQLNAFDSLLNTYNVTDDNEFILAGYSEENFDDMLVWLSPHVLFSKLVSAGKLP